MRVYFILHVFHIAGKIIVESVIYGISRGNNMVGMTRVLNPLQFVPLYKGVEEISIGVESWLRFCRVEIWKNTRPSDWFEQKGDNLLWETPPSAANTELEILTEERIQSPYKPHLMVVPRLMTFL